jgi:hypothetical protein
MNISKRTIIIAVIAILAFLAAMASLYFEQKQIIDDLESISEDIPGNERKVRKKKVNDEPIQPEQTEGVIIDGGNVDNNVKPGE